MSNKLLKNDPQSLLEARVATLEKELAQMKLVLNESIAKKDPWWFKIAGSFENDPTFDEAVALGLQWRKSVE